LLGLQPRLLAVIRTWRGGPCEALVVSGQILSFTMEITDRISIMGKGEFVYQAERKNVDTTKIHLYLTI
jgi:ABC-type branched-subunit amino acid transport system ATPase component